MPLSTWTERDRLLSEALHMRDLAMGLCDPAPHAIHRLPDGRRDIVLKTWDAADAFEDDDEDELLAGYRVAENFDRLDLYEDELRTGRKPVMTTDDRAALHSADAHDRRALVESQWADGAACAVYIDLQDAADREVIVEEVLGHLDPDDPEDPEEWEWLKLDLERALATPTPPLPRTGHKRIKGLVGRGSPRPLPIDEALHRWRGTIVTERGMDWPPQPQPSLPPQPPLPPGHARPRPGPDSKLLRDMADDRFNRRVLETALFWERATGLAGVWALLVRCDTVGWERRAPRPVAFMAPRQERRYKSRARLEWERLYRLASGRLPGALVTALIEARPRV